MPDVFDESLRAVTNHLLPMEILINVFSYLNAIALARASQVCRAWAQVPWTKLDLSACVDDIQWIKVRICWSTYMCAMDK